MVVRLPECIPLYTSVLPYILATQWVHDVESLVKGIGTCLVAGIYQGYIVNIWDILMSGFCKSQSPFAVDFGPLFFKTLQ